jgi:inorganic pyrophosphatase
MFILVITNLIVLFKRTWYNLKKIYGLEKNIISQIDIVPLCIVPAKVIGVMRMLDGGEADDKIISVAAGDPGVNHFNDISELPSHFKSELKNFFKDSKNWKIKLQLLKTYMIKKLY